MVAFADVAEPDPADDEAVIACRSLLDQSRRNVFAREPAPWVAAREGHCRASLHSARNGRGPAVGALVVGHPPARGWAERVAVPVTQLATIPEHMDTTAAAALPLAGLTALRLLRTVGALAGRRLLLTGASGGVGHFFVELAAAAGADVTVVVGAPERGRRLIELGANRALLDVADAPESMDVILESVGGASLSAALTRLAPRGLLVWFGQAGRIPATIDFFSFFNQHQSATIRHFDYTDSDVSDGADLATLVRLVEAGRLHPEIGSVSDWGETSARLTDLRTRRIRGKAILTL